jgi:drug/metabolite transporter (DMT)-like permease
LLIACGLNTVLAYGALPIAFQNLPTSQVSVIIAANPLLTILIMSFLALFRVEWIKPELITGLGYFAAGLVVAGVVLVVTAKASNEKLGSKAEIV